MVLLLNVPADRLRFSNEGSAAEQELEHYRIMFFP